MEDTEMAFRMRSSKFRHVYGNPSKKENCYECIKITKNAHDSNFCAVNPKFVAIVTESAGGGAFLILPLEKVGRVDINAFKVCGHSGPVLDIKWNPFDDYIIASCSDDATIKLWQVPGGGLTSNLTEWMVDLHGHQRRVGHIAWHPTAQSVLLSAGYDHKIIVWNTDTAEPVNIIGVHSDTIFSIAWNMDGSLIASTSKDKKIRIIDPRSGEVISEGQGHAGSKSSKVLFLGDKNRLFTTGFSRMSERQLAVWDGKNMSRPLTMETIDASSGVLFPFYDSDTNVVFVAGKGDGNIRYYEIVSEHPYLHYLSQYQSSSPQRGLGVMPKRGIDPSKCEIVRFYKLHAVKGICEPVSMIVPRKSEMFQEDIFPPTASACPSLTAEEWISGQDRQPILISLKDGNILPVVKAPSTKTVHRKGGYLLPVAKAPSTKTVHRKDGYLLPVAKVPSTRTVHRKPPDDRPPLGRSISNSSGTGIPSPVNTKSPKPRATSGSTRINKKEQSNKKDGKKDGMKKETSKKDGAMSHSPVITTYKAVKRGSGQLLTSAPAERIGSKRQSTTTTTPPTATVAPSPGRLPPSLHNIRKMTAGDDSDRENENEDIDENDNNNSVNDRISSFEKKTGVNVTKSVMRMTNNNQPLRVERKIWSSSYTQQNQNQSTPPNTSNGVPRTDPELESLESDHRGPSKVSTVSTSVSDNEVPNPSVTTTATTSTAAPSIRSQHHRNHSSAALEQAEQELYANLKIEVPRSHHHNLHQQQQQHYQSQEQPRQTRRSIERSRSRLSDSGSEMFTTPPTSPLRSRPAPTKEVIIVSTSDEQVLNQSCSPSPNNRGSSSDHSVFIQDSPASWTANPIYNSNRQTGTTTATRSSASSSTGSPTSRYHRDSSQLSNSNNKSPGRRRTSSRDSTESGSVVGEKIAELEMSRESPLRRSLRSSFRSRNNKETTPTEQNNNNNINVSNPTPYRRLSNGTTGGHLEENNNINKALNGNSDSTITEGKGVEDIAHIEFDGCFPSDAPDHTLMKPSKLRASLRGRRRHTNTGAPGSDSTNAAREALCLSPIIPTRREQSTRETSSSKQQSMSRSSSHQNNNEKNVFILENKSRTRSSIASCSATEKIPYSSQEAVPSVSNSHQPTPYSITSRESEEHVFFDHLNANTSDALIRPSKLRDSFRKQRSRQKHIENGNNSTTGHDQVKTVPPLSPDPSPTSLPLEHLDVNTLSDAELRKAYFRQVEEISSLKEQIGLKDKRIRQLEEEVRVLRDGRDLVGESTC